MTYHPRSHSPRTTGSEVHALVDVESPWISSVIDVLVGIGQSRSDRGALVREARELPPYERKVHVATHGSMTSMPHPSKSLAFRVATAAA